MRNWLVFILGIFTLACGGILIKGAQAVEGNYRYPRAARVEARQFARTIQDPEERQAFLNDTTGKVMIEHPKKLFAGGILVTVGFGMTLGSLHYMRKNWTRKKAKTAISKAA